MGGNPVNRRLESNPRLILDQLHSNAKAEQRKPRFSPAIMHSLSDNGKFILSSGVRNVLGKLPRHAILQPLDKYVLKISAMLPS